MVDVAGGEGYSAASAAKVAERAEVSRGTFYKHFRNREQCFLAAYDELARRLRRALREVDSLPAEGRPRAALTAILSGAELWPAAVRVMTIEVLGAGSLARRRRMRLHAAIEGSIARYLGELPPGGRRPCLPPGALIGGVEAIVGSRAFRGEHERLGSLLFDLLDWLESYAAPAEEIPSAGEWERMGAALRPASAASGWEPEQPEGGSRQRVLSALPYLMVARGYRETTVGDIVAAARIGRESFYRDFAGKEGAFHATQTAALQVAIARAAEAFFGADSWPNRVWRGLEALFNHTAENPELAYLDAVESCAVGGEAVRRSFDNRVAFGIFLHDGWRQGPKARRLPALCSEAIGGAILELLRDELLSGEAGSTLTILPRAAYLALAPFLGAEEALRFVQCQLLS